jgi:hypothetical protein
LVAGHLNAVSEKRQATLVARFLVEVLELYPPAGGDFSDAVDSFRRRVERHWGREEMCRRAALLAKVLELPLRFD